MEFDLNQLNPEEPIFAVSIDGRYVLKTGVLSSQLVILPVKQKIGRNRPYGLQNDPYNRGKTIKNCDEQAMIQIVVERWKAGDSLRAIARWLDGEKVPKRKGSKNWHHWQVRRILVKAGLVPEKATKRKNQFEF